MLATDIETLPQSLKDEIQQFFTDNIQWLTRVLRAQYSVKTFSNQRLYEMASMIMSTLQGAMNIAKAMSDQSYFTNAVKELLSFREGAEKLEHKLTPTKILLPNILEILENLLSLYRQFKNTQDTVAECQTSQQAINSEWMIQQSQEANRFLQQQNSN